MWTVVYVDGRLDMHEDHLMHKLSDLLRLSHVQLMDIKVKVLRAHGGQRASIT